jgi:hypothetical protein
MAMVLAEDHEPSALSIGRPQPIDFPEARN